VTKGQLFTLLFAFILRHCCTKAAICDLIALFNAILPGCIPHTLYFFRKLLSNGDVNDVETHVYCSKCGSYLSNANGNCDMVMCNECESVVSVGDMVKNGCTFLLFPLKSQLQTLFEKMCLWEHMNVNNCDIADGTEYKKLNINFPHSLSLTCNTDGIPVFSSSNTTLWPVYFIINELPLRLRHIHMMLNALWIGKCKPRMDTLFTPIIAALENLYNVGFNWSKNAVVFNTKVYMCLLSVDSVARAPLQNIKQFNGEYGCGWCLNPGYMVNKGLGQVRVYLQNSGENHRERSHASTAVHAEHSLEEGRCIFGVKGPSLFFLVPSFDIVRGFVPDYMHSVLLGVVRQFMFLWFDSTSHSKPYYLGQHLSQIDAMLVGIKPPSEVKRLPRSIGLRKYWKAAEFRNFLLLYTPVCLRTFMPKNYLHHWFLLHFAIYNLMKREITRETLALCDVALHKFVVLVETLYGKEHVSYNVHLLTHLTTSVERWGPLWATSAFLFEDANGKLLTYFHGTRGIAMQIFKSFSGAAHLRILAQRYITGSCLSLLNQITSTSSYCKNAVRIGNDITGMGFPSKRLLRATEILAVRNLFPTAHLCSNEVTTYKRVIVNGKMLHTSSYSESVKVNDHCVAVRNQTGSAFLIQSCVTVNICTNINCIDHDAEEKFVFLAVAANVCGAMPVYDNDVDHNMASHISKVVVDANTLFAFSSCDFSHKVFMFSDHKDCTFVTQLPQFEID